jgi:hypothetical protein
MTFNAVPHAAAEKLVRLYGRSLAICSFLFATLGDRRVAKDEFNLEYALNKPDAVMIFLDKTECVS